MILYCLVLHHLRMQAFSQNMHHITKWWIHFEGGFCCWGAPKLTKLYWKILLNAVHLFSHNLTFPTTPIPFMFFDVRFQISIKCNVNSVGNAICNVSPWKWTKSFWKWTISTSINPHKFSTSDSLQVLCDSEPISQRLLLPRYHQLVQLLEFLLECVLTTLEA